MELKDQSFDVEACCVRVVSSRKKGVPRVLPDMKLKVVMEAMRMALQGIYETRFVTFSYGGRVGMGRHTAVRYLKGSIRNPNWWFRVGFPRQKFEGKHVNRLMQLMAEKIQDAVFLDLVKKLFDTNVIRIEIGGLDWGRGFPQEIQLSWILINIYYNGFDHLIQDLRLETQMDNPRISPDKDVVEEEGNRKFHGFHNPLRVYAVRYFDDILLITSGSKLFTADLKNKLVYFLETNLNLRIDKQRTTIHSAVKEKMAFMGMELQAVPPSILHPPMSEKATRAQKKYLKMKSAQVMELKNARETRRKKLGLKILNNVFTKLKRYGVQFNSNIEKDNIKVIFRGWAEGAVEEFFSSKEECFNLHRALSSGNFLGLRKIRDQLPTELVDSYDEFQRNLDKYLLPSHSIIQNSDEDDNGNNDVMSDSDGGESEAEKEMYAKRTVEDLTTLCMRVNAPIELVRRIVKMVGFTNLMGRPRPIKLLISLDDSDIVKWYAGIGNRWLDYYCCCRNFKLVKTIVSYHLRFSCFLTLAEKHESTKLQTIKHYTKDLKVEDKVYFPTEREIKMMGDNNLSDPRPVDGVSTMILVKLALSETSKPCAAHFCEENDSVALYRVRLLQNRLNVDPRNERKWVAGLGAIDECLNKKCFPFCLKHANDLYLGNISLQDVDCTSFIDVL